MNSIFARKREIKVLEKLNSSNQPEFLAIYGRRRIGKTFLIRQFFKQKGLYFELTGTKTGTLRQQLRNFAIEFQRVFGKKVSVKDWQEAFNELRMAIENSKTSERIILFFDELPWLATRKSYFLQALDYFWNRYMSDDKRVILIVCGSAASWMIKKVVQDKGGLHGRLTAQIRLLPFDLLETESFLQNRGITLERKQIISVYMAIGGVAKYLTLIEKGQSALQSISQICFNGRLFKEFEELYSSLFENHERHISVVKALAEASGGLTKTQISEIAKISSGGTLTTILKELEASGFIVPMSSFDKKRYDLRYRLIDEYSLFYLKWITQVKSFEVEDDYWLKMSNTPAGRAWSGYAFESLCMKHIQKIKRALGIASVITREYAWVANGAQIDLLIERDDNCINLCEIKFAKDEFIIDKSYASELRAKKSIFLEKTATKKSVFLTLITTYGIKKNDHSVEVVDVELTMKDLFGLED